VELRNLPLTALKAFEVVGRHCHIRRAAEEMHVAHSSLSRHVRQLEQRLDVKLFSREGNRLALTAPGRRLLTVVQQALGQLSEGILYLDPDNMSGEVVIAATASITMGWLLPVLNDFQSRYPEIQLRIITIEPQQQELPAEFDLAVCLGKPNAHSRSLEKLYEERYQPVCSPQLLKSKRLHNAKELLALPLLHDNLNQWGKWLASQKVTPARALNNCYFDYAYQAIEAARLGMGVVLADLQEVRSDIDAGRLVAAMADSFTVGQSVYLLTDAAEQQSIRARLLVAAIREWLPASTGRV